MKEPDEIKNGLEVCASGAEFGCIDRFCPYGYLEDEGERCDSVLCDDALAYIQQLEADIEIQEIKRNAMFAKAEQLERERDFLLKYLTDSNWAACDICKHEPEEGNIHACKRIREVKGAPCFEWRGLPEV